MKTYKLKEEMPKCVKCGTELPWLRVDCPKCGFFNENTIWEPWEEEDETSINLSIYGNPRSEQYE